MIEFKNTALGQYTEYLYSFKCLSIIQQVCNKKIVFCKKQQISHTPIKILLAKKQHRVNKKSNLMNKQKVINNSCVWEDTLSRGHREGGPIAHSKNLKTPFFKRYWKILSRGYSNGSRTSPIFFLFEISQQIWLLEASKVLAEMGRGWQADWATAKLFLSI